MAYPQETIDQIRSAIQLSQVVGKTVRLKKHGPEHTGLCPFHNEKTPSFFVNDQKGFYHCFGCGANGDLFDYVMNTANLGFSEAIERLASEAGVTLPEQNTHLSKEAISKREKIFSVLLEAESWYHRQIFLKPGSKAFSYLKNRGLSEHEIQHFKLGFCPNTAYGQVPELETYLKKKGYTDEIITASGVMQKSSKGPYLYDRLFDRLIFPIADFKDRVIAFGGRVLEDRQPKYLNTQETPIFQKRETLYNFFEAKQVCRENQIDPIVVEGYMDVIMLHKFGFRNTVAPLGTSLTEEHLQKLWQISKKPILCFDGDVAGYSAAIRVIEKFLPELSADKLLQFVFLPNKQDPDSYVNEFGKQAFQTMLDSALSISDLLWTIETWQKDLKNPEERTNIEANIFKKINLIKDFALKKNYQQFFKQKLFEATRSSKAKQQHTSYQRNNETQDQLYLISKYEKVLLATCINHPYLLEEYIEELAKITFSNQQYNTIMQEILSIDFSMLSSISLKEHLNMLGYEKAITNILSVDVLLFAKFAADSTTKENAEAGLKTCIDLLNLDQYKKDIQQAELQLAEHMTGDQYNHLIELKKRFS